MPTNDPADELEAMKGAWPNAPHEVWVEWHEHIHIQEQTRLEARTRLVVPDHGCQTPRC
jgi:hypothetical protein